MISIIVAIAENYAIGKNNQLLWHLPEDLKRFKRITEGHPVVMGKNTFYSLPKRPLPGRTNIVLTDIQGEQIEGCQMAYSVKEAMQYCTGDKESFIIGGASIYQQFFTIVDKLYITKVHANFEADTYFPEIKQDTWKIIESESRKADDKHKYDYTFITYQRK